MAPLCNYFTCTLDQAAALNSKVAGSAPRSVHEFLEAKVATHGDRPAVGFYIPRRAEDWTTKILTYRQVSNGVQATAKLLQGRHGPALAAADTVGLLCSSSPEFMFIWLALMRLGKAVLLLAPQLSASAVAHLCGQCSVSCLVHDAKNAELARSSESATNLEISKGISLVALADVFDQDVWRVLTHTQSSDASSDLEVRHTQAEDVAYLFHTSGTSSGLPKPIPQSHRAAVTVLPQSLDGSREATFTTTPLYHGGIADLLRSWSGDSLIWLFPSQHLPITAENVIRCLDVAASSAKQELAPLVTYFSSVPYVLQMLKEDPQGLAHLKRMALVGVGGAALSKEIGDQLVNDGVRLISRFGSAECGFLLSSHRDNFADDQAWQHLRHDPQTSATRFEKQDDDTSELIVSSSWPHLAKTNREDGSYATSDLFVPHPTIANAWKYHSRADSQLTLVTGKKFDPAPLEAELTSSPLLRDVLIFGNDKPFAGVLLFRSDQAKGVTDDDLVAQVWPILKTLNADSQEHATISRSMLVPRPFDDRVLEKSSKGTVMRKKAEETFGDIIDAAYEGSNEDENIRNLPDAEIGQYILSTVRELKDTKKSLKEDSDLFSYGLDSIASIHLRNKLRALLPADAGPLPPSLVEQCGTPKALARYVVRQRHKDTHAESCVEAQNDAELMRDMVNRWSTFEIHSDHVLSESRQDPDRSQSQVVVLTGATGALGAHILHLYRADPMVQQIYCLVRASGAKGARSRVDDSLKRRGLPPLGQDAEGTRIEVLAAELDHNRLGLDDETYKRIAREATVIQHVAWTVNFRMHLRSFEQSNISGLRHLLDLALSSPQTRPPAFVYCSSVASCSAWNESALIPSSIIADPAAASPLGYSQSKWVAEQICDQANKHTRLAGNIAVVRVGQLSGDTDKGIWNQTEAWPLMLSSLALTKCLPRLEKQPLDWLPVDIAARCFLECGTIIDKSDGGDLAVLHVLNDEPSSQWSDLLGWLGKIETFETVDVQEWLARLEQLADPDFPALMLLDHWKTAYASEAADSGQDEKPQRITKFDMHDSKKRLPSLRDAYQIDVAYVAKIWRQLKADIAQ